MILEFIKRHRVAFGFILFLFLVGLSTGILLAATGLLTVVAAVVVALGIFVLPLLGIVPYIGYRENLFMQKVEKEIEEELGELKKLGMDFKEAGNKEFRKTLSVAKQGNVEKQLDAASQYDIWIEYWKNDRSAQQILERYKAKYYQLAADQGNAVAQNNLGVHYQYGVGVQVDLAKAIECYQLAATQRNVNAQFNLGLCYEKGEGVPKNLVNAVHYYQLAADRGYANAQFRLGVCYQNGLGVPKNLGQAVSYYNLAAVSYCNVDTQSYEHTKSILAELEKQLQTVTSSSSVASHSSSTSQATLPSNTSTTATSATTPASTMMTTNSSTPQSTVTTAHSSPLKTTPLPQPISPEEKAKQDSKKVRDYLITLFNPDGEFHKSVALLPFRGSLPYLHEVLQGGALEFENCSGATPVYEIIFRHVAFTIPQYGFFSTEEKRQEAIQKGNCPTMGRGGYTYEGLSIDNTTSDIPERMKALSVFVEAINGKWGPDTVTVIRRKCELQMGKQEPYFYEYQAKISPEKIQHILSLSLNESPSLTH